MASDFVRWNERKVDPATGMDIAFLDGPHRNNPRRLRTGSAITIALLLYASINADGGY